MSANQQIAIPSVNHKYKDRLFRRIFNNPESLLTLYNAINGTSYHNPEDLIINTLEDAIYLSMKNDLSFIIYDELNLFEHQSTLNQNMPLRGLLYFAELLKKYIAEKNLDMYSSARLSLPFPRFVVFYNGSAPYPELGEMLLSSSYETAHVQDKEPALECRALVLNINIGQNRELMEECKELWGYSYFIGRIRYYQNNSHCSLSEAVDRAIEDCLQAGALADYLRIHRQEAKTLILFEYDEKKHLKNERELAKAEGKTEHLLRLICRKLKKNKDANQVADELEEDILTIEPLYNFALQFAPDFDENEVCGAWFNENFTPNIDSDLF